MAELNDKQNSAWFPVDIVSAELIDAIVKASKETWRTKCRDAASAEMQMHCSSSTQISEPANEDILADELGKMKKEVLRMVGVEHAEVIPRVVQLMEHILMLHREVFALEEPGAVGGPQKDNSSHMTPTDRKSSAFTASTNDLGNSNQPADLEEKDSGIQLATGVVQLDPYHEYLAEKVRKQEHKIVQLKDELEEAFRKIDRLQLQLLSWTRKDKGKLLLDTSRQEAGTGILHSQMKTFDAEDKELVPKDPLTRSSGKACESKYTILLKWCQDKIQPYSEMKIMDFCTSWEDGVAFCVLMRYLEGSITVGSADVFAKRDPKENLESVKKWAEALGIKATLDVDAITGSDDKPDWKNIYSFLNDLYNHFNKERQEDDD